MRKSGELLLLMLCDFSEQTYTVIDHNLSRWAALKKTAVLRKQNLPAFTVKQDSKHQNPEAETCPFCKKQIERAFAGWKQTKKKG